MSDFFNNKYKVAEKFVSINGEGKRAGQLAVFVRFAGCNLKCRYCDTMWANEPDVDFDIMTDEQILSYILDTKVKNVTLTGGEPLLQNNISGLITLLIENGIRVEIETNGSIPILPVRDKCEFYIREKYNNLDTSIYTDVRLKEVKDIFMKNEMKVLDNLSFTVDYKTGSSGMEKFMYMSNFADVTQNDTVKFVCGSVEDLKTAKRIIDRFRLSQKCSVYLSPVFGDIKPADMVEFMKQENMNDVNLQIQMHKVIWEPDAKGV